MVQNTRFGSTCPIKGSDRSDSARCSAFRRRDSCEGAKLDGLRSLNEVGEIGEVNGDVGGGAAGGVGNEEEETRAIRCFEGGGTLSMLGILAETEPVLVLGFGRLCRQAVLC
jgi:hypothetical protein